MICVLRVQDRPCGNLHAVHDHMDASLIGLVQAARQFWKKAVEVLKEIGFVGGQADPCLMTKSSDEGTVHIIMYVDDFLCVGDLSALNLLEKELKESGLVIKVTENLTDYLSCEIKLDEKMESGYLRQPHLIASLKKSFEEMVKKSLPTVSASLVVSDFFEVANSSIK